jgi:hypothetical protein
MSTSIIGRIDEMGNRIDDLEKSISDLMQQVSFCIILSLKSFSRLFRFMIRLASIPRQIWMRKKTSK